MTVRIKKDNRNAKSITLMLCSSFLKNLQNLPVFIPYIMKLHNNGNMFVAGNNTLLPFYTPNNNWFSLMVAFGFFISCDFEKTAKKTASLYFSCCSHFIARFSCHSVCKGCSTSRCRAVPVELEKQQ